MDECKNKLTGTTEKQRIYNVSEGWTTKYLMATEHTFDLLSGRSEVRIPSWTRKHAGALKAPVFRGFSAFWAIHFQLILSHISSLLSNILLIPC